MVEKYPNLIGSYKTQGGFTAHVSNVIGSTKYREERLQGKVGHCKVEWDMNGNDLLGLSAFNLRLETRSN